MFLAYRSGAGHALIDRALYLPKEWAEDADRRREAKVPESVKFATKPELAREMLTNALSAGVPAKWVTADEVYGSDFSHSGPAKLWPPEQILSSISSLRVRKTKIQGFMRKTRLGICGRDLLSSSVVLERTTVQSPRARGSVQEESMAEALLWTRSQRGTSLRLGICDLAPS